MNASDIRLVGFDRPRPWTERPLREALAGLDAEKAVDRVWAKDWTLWKDRDEEISNRLGWLDAVDESRGAAADRRISSAACGPKASATPSFWAWAGRAWRPKSSPGSSARAPAASAWKSSTAPIPPRSWTLGPPCRSTGRSSSSRPSRARRWRRAPSCPISSPKSRPPSGRNGRDARSPPITDPGTSLARLAASLAFRRVFRGDPNVGGRFSAFTPFGLVPAALLGSRHVRPAPAAAGRPPWPAGSRSPAAIPALISEPSSGRRPAGDIDKIGLCLSARAWPVWAPGSSS